MSTMMSSFAHLLRRRVAGALVLLLLTHLDDAALVVVHAVNLEYDLSLIPTNCPDVRKALYTPNVPAVKGSVFSRNCGLSSSTGSCLEAWVCFTDTIPFGYDPTSQAVVPVNPLNPAAGYMFYCLEPRGCENAGIQSQCVGKADFYNPYPNGQVPVQQGKASHGGYYVCSKPNPNPAPGFTSGYDLGLIHKQCSAGARFCSTCSQGAGWYCDDSENPFDPKFGGLDNAAITRDCKSDEAYFSPSKTNGVWLCPTCSNCQTSGCETSCPPPMLRTGLPTRCPFNPLKPLQTCGVGGEGGDGDGDGGVEAARRKKKASRKACRLTLRSLRAAYVTDTCMKEGKKKKACVREAREVFPKKLLCPRGDRKQKMKG